MQLAYYIAAHRKAAQFGRLFNAVYSPEDLYLINLDARSDAGFKREVRDICSGAANVMFVPEREMHWGGWNQCAAELEAIEMALSSGVPWQRFLNLSGQCFPVRHPDELKAMLARQPQNFIRCIAFEDIGPESRFHAKRRISIILGGRSRRLPVSMPRPTSFRFNWKGSQWHVLTRDFCEWIVKDPLAQSIKRYLRRLHIPDETLFQTLLMNSPFAPGAGRSLHQIYWPGPRTIRLSNLPDIDSKDVYFARKFDDEVDPGVLDALEARLQSSLAQMRAGHARGGKLNHGK